MITDLVFTGPLQRDISIVCRICLKNKGTVAIFPEIAQENEFTLREKIMSFAYVEIVEDDDLPSRICKKCCMEISRAFKLKAQCEYADFVLRQHLMGEDAEDEENLLTDDILDKFVVENVAEKESPDGVEEESATDHPTSSDKTHDTNNQFISTPDNVRDNIKELEIVVPSATNIFEDALDITIDASEPRVIVEESGNFSGNLVNNNDILAGVEVPSIILTANKSNEQCVKLIKESKDVTKHKGVRVRKRNREVEGVTEVHRCEFCDKAYSFEGSLWNHILKEHEPSGEYPCNECGRTFPQEILLNMHVKTHTAERPYCCSFCGKCFRLPQTLQSHERHHKPKRKFLCNHCGKLFASNKAHVCPVVNMNRERAYECNICGKKFLRQVTLNIHSKRHRLVEKYRCKTCSKPFYSKQELERHTNVHLGVRPFSCDFDECEHSFYTKGELNRHMRYHRGEKKFKCDQCELSFFESGHLVNHKRKHTGERPYICEVCSKSFADTSKLRRHINIHYNASSPRVLKTTQINTNKR